MWKCIWTFNQTGTIPLLGTKLLNRNGTSCMFITLSQGPLRALLQGSCRALLQGSFRALLQGTFRALLQGTFRALLQGTFRLLLQGTFRALLQSPSTGHFQSSIDQHNQVALNLCIAKQWKMLNHAFFSVYAKCSISTAAYTTGRSI